MTSRGRARQAMPRVGQAVQRPARGALVYRWRRASSSVKKPVSSAAASIPMHHGHSRRRGQPSAWGARPRAVRADGDLGRAAGRGAGRVRASASRCSGVRTAAEPHSQVSTIDSNARYVRRSHSHRSNNCSAAPGRETFWIFGSVHLHRAGSGRGIERPGAGGEFIALDRPAIRWCRRGRGGIDRAPLSGRDGPR